MTFDDVLASPAFALLHRPDAGDGRVEVLAGEAETVPALAGLPLPDDGILAVVPFRQITGSGLTAVDDGTPLVAIRPRTRFAVPLAEALRALPRTPATGASSFDESDAAYADAVRTVLRRNIAGGDGPNFVLRRTCRGRLAAWSPRHALAAYRRLLTAERGAYWTFLVHFDGRTLLGATPECQVRVRGGVATMTPISGTWRYPAGGPTAAGLRRFLADPKEAGELLMVVDEELKTMARVCRGGGRVHGPRLRLMSRLAHTEYTVDGPTDLDVREVLRLTLPAPTVTGSPVARACRVIAGHERTGRGYYGGALALAAPGDLDSALLIRTADIDAEGRFTVAAGATLVRGSDPDAEARETRAKASALLGALLGAPPPQPPRPVRRVPVRADHGLSTFWCGPRAPAPEPAVRLTIVAAGDDFTGMLAHMAESLGVAVRVVPWHRAGDLDGDVVLLGPGPGDPRDRTDPRVGALHRLAGELLARRRPLLAVCLGHQVLAALLGLHVTRLGEPAQGVRRRIVLDGRSRLVGFYNSFAALSCEDQLMSPYVRGPVRVTRDARDGVVHALAAPGIRSVQFHVESLLTEDGPEILGGMLAAVTSPSDDRLDSGGPVRQGASRHVRC
ncbi:chorismate-binding protein [Actinoplanes sp. URMC 104]|uniref:chorismate-binding protein n=1 Tax=Actinoplanes sp. URMC 104 TaxID=3423409 RepID=UPI003F1DC91E